MRNEDSGIALQTSPNVAPTRAAGSQFEDKRPKAINPTPATDAAKPRLDQDSKAALS